MLVTDKYLAINIRHNPKLGEDSLLQVLSEFSCPKNPDLKNQKRFANRIKSTTWSLKIFQRSLRQRSKRCLKRSRNVQLSLTAIISSFHKRTPRSLSWGFLLAMYIAMSDYSLTVSAKVVSTSAAGVAASVTASDSDSKLVLIISQRPQLDV